jgi:putative CocE/NonD family hydrolase
MLEKVHALVIRNCSTALLVLGVAVALAVFAAEAHSQEPPAPIRDLLEKTIENEGVDAAIQQYRDLRETTPEKYDLGPRQLISVGRSLIRKGRFQDGIAFYRLGEEFFPDSENVSLNIGWSYMRQALAENNNDYATTAEAYFERTLALDPDNQFAEVGLNRLYMTQNYVKREYKIPMRDGARLTTHVYSPNRQELDLPILLHRRPYGIGSYGEEKSSYLSMPGPSSLFSREGYIFVLQDVRGRFMSEGEFEHMRPHIRDKNGPTHVDESSDTYDTIEWLIKNVPENNGRVGMWGNSYMGFYSVHGLLDAHPAISASAPAGSPADWFVGDDIYRNGALHYFYALDFLNSMGLGRPEPTPDRAEPLMSIETDDVYNFLLEIGPIANIDDKYFRGRNAFWTAIADHSRYDEFWQRRNNLQYLHGIKTPVLNVGAWFDAEDLYGTLKTYEAIEANNPGIENTLVIGPWYHGGWGDQGSEFLGDVRMESGSAGAYFQENVEFPFFNHYLKGERNWNPPEALVFETGTNRWREYDTWPPKTAMEKYIYLHPGGRLAFSAPAGESGGSFTEYTSDPGNPVPYVGHPVEEWDYDFMIADQRFAADRPDVLVFSTEALDENLTIVGPMTADLYVSTSGTDADWIVKVIDVFPGDPALEGADSSVEMAGYQMLVRSDIMRGKFRNSLERPEPFIPGEVSNVAFELLDINHTFRRGHRVMVQIQSTRFPLFDLNPQGFMDIWRAEVEDFKPARHRVYHTGDYASHIRVSIVE